MATWSVFRLLAANDVMFRFAVFARDRSTKGAFIFSQQMKEASHEKPVLKQVTKSCTVMGGISVASISTRSLNRLFDLFKENHN